MLVTAIRPHATEDSPAQPDKVSATGPLVADFACEPDEWEEFLRRLPHSHHAQSHYWALCKAPQGWESHRVVVRRDGAIAAGAQILVRRMPLIGAMGFIPYGPLKQQQEPALIDAIYQALSETARRKHLHYLLVQPARSNVNPGGRMPQRFTAMGLCIEPQATIQLDLTQDLDEILAQMAAKTRYNVRLSGRREIHVRTGTRGDLPAYHSLLQATGSRKEFTVHDLAYYEHLWDTLHPQGMVQLFLAEWDGTLLAAQIGIIYNGTYWNKMSVWSGAEGSRRPNEAIQWAAIRWAKEAGCHTYDLEGIEVDAARAVLQGNELDPSHSQTVTSFKLGFGGQVVLYNSCLLCAPNPLFRVSRHLLLETFAHSEVGDKIMHMLRTGALLPSRKAKSEE